MNAHEHGLDIPNDDIPHPTGREFNYPLISDLVGAALDGCTSCQDPLLTLLLEDSDSVARLVELACVATQETIGGLTPSMYDQSAPGLSSREFRRLANAGAGGQNEAMFALAATMNTEERRAAVNTALDTLAGILGR